MNSLWDNFLICVTIVLRDSPVAVGLIIALCILSADLFVTLVKQLLRISQNITQIEISFYEREEAKNAGKGEEKERIRNFYDKGFIKNWTETLFPTDYDYEYESR